MIPSRNTGMKGRMTHYRRATTHLNKMQAEQLLHQLEAAPVMGGLPLPKLTDAWCDMAETDALRLELEFDIADPTAPDLFLLRESQHLERATAWALEFGGVPGPLYRVHGAPIFGS